MNEKEALWWMLECPKYGEPCYCKEECMYLRQKSKKMTEQQTPDREKKIAEIREGYKSERDDNFTYKKEIVEQDIRFLLSELERLEREYAEERAAHNAHVAELCELERELDMYKASSEVFYERSKKAYEERNRLFERLKDITSTLGGVTFTDGRQWGAYNALCDIVEDIEKELSK